MATRCNRVQQVYMQRQEQKWRAGRDKGTFGNLWVTKQYVGILKCTEDGDDHFW